MRRRPILIAHHRSFFNLLSWGAGSALSVLRILRSADRPAHLLVGTGLAWHSLLTQAYSLFPSRHQGHLTYFFRFLHATSKNHITTASAEETPILLVHQNTQASR